MTVHATGCNGPEPEYSESYQEQPAHDLAAAFDNERNSPARDEHSCRTHAKEHSVADRKSNRDTDGTRPRRLSVTARERNDRHQMVRSEAVYEPKQYSG
jgi:hypothetical protein